MLINVGDLVTGKENNGYCITSKDSLCVVRKINHIMGLIDVKLIGGKLGDVGAEFEALIMDRFVKTTYEEFQRTHPGADYIDNINYYVNHAENKEEKKMELRMKKDNVYVLTNEERDSLRKEMMELMEEYDYKPTVHAVNEIIDEWVGNKGWLINLFKKHPNYNGKYQIVFDADYHRLVDRNVISDFCCYANSITREKLMVEKKFGFFTLDEVYGYYAKLYDIVNHMKQIQTYGYTVKANGRTLDDLSKELNEWLSFISKIQNDPSVYVTSRHAYDKGKYDTYKKAQLFFRIVENNTEPAATEEFAKYVNELFPDTKAVVGQKTSRIVNKVCKALGLDTDPGYNRQFAMYSDAINPLAIKRHTILSVHPIDYLTMSFGKNWASCHTIDKDNKRGAHGEHYRGCYSSGTMSYMLDGSSFVFYTVDKEYNGNEYELQDKINRNMFHIGEDKLIQGRVYPQGTDGASEIYRQLREIVQKVIADCLGVPNMWKNVKGTAECERVVESDGTHYRDYESYSDCNVSYLKYSGTEEVNIEIITVGHDPICPHCGNSHTYSEAIECEDCYNDYETCENCGCSHSREYMHEIDGYYYCDDCCFYCDYHEEWEVGEGTCVDDYGMVCDDAIENSGDFYRCDRCGEVHYTGRCDDHIITEDGNDYCSDSCARRDGYSMTDDGEWYPEEEVHYCEHCDNNVHDRNWNEELNCCVDCQEEVAAELEAESEERETM